MTKHDWAGLDNPICLHLGHEFKVKPFLIETKEKKVIQDSETAPNILI